jgi:DNA-binding ferritin-like protein
MHKVTSQERVVLAADMVTSVQAAFSQWVVDSVASYGNAPMAELAVVLAAIQAETTIHHTHHWMSKGNQAYGDHLLFDRLYGDTQGMVDGLAEKAVGTGSEVLVQPLAQAQQVLGFLEVVYSDSTDQPDPQTSVFLSLRSALMVMDLIDWALESLDSKGELSNGVENQLQGLSDNHETFVYLLKQRTKTDPLDSRVMLASADAMAWKTG